MRHVEGMRTITHDKDRRFSHAHGPSLVVGANVAQNRRRGVGLIGRIEMLTNWKSESKQKVPIVTGQLFPSSNCSNGLTSRKASPGPLRNGRVARAAPVPPFLSAGSAQKGVCPLAPNRFAQRRL